MLHNIILIKNITKLRGICRRPQRSLHQIPCSINKTSNSLKSRRSTNEYATKSWITVCVKVNNIELKGPNYPQKYLKLSIFKRICQMYKVSKEVQRSWELPKI